MKKILSLITTAAIACSCFTAAVHAEEGVILSTDFETDAGGFNVRGTASVDTSTAAAYSGEASLLIEGRGGDAWNGAARGLGGIKLDETYKAVAYVKAADPGESFEVKMSLEVTDFNGTAYPQLGTATVNSEQWTKIEGTWKADYTGNLNTINLNFETSDNGIGKSFYVDDVFFALSSVKAPQIAEPEVKQKAVNYSGIELADDVVGTKYETSIGMMQALGVMDGYPDGTFKPEKEVTRAEFLTMLLRLVKAQDIQTETTAFSDVPATHFANGYIGYAVARNICSGYGDGLFGPDDPVTYAQAVKMLLGIMGYTMVAEQNGGFPGGYIKAAADNKISASDVSQDEALNRGSVTELFASALDAPLYMIDYSDNSIYRDKTATIITEYYDGIYEKGYVISNNTSTVSNSKSSLDSVNIDGVQYKVGKTRADELVGYYVKYIASQPDSGDDGELLYIDINASKNDTLVISAKDIEDYSDYQYEYYTDEKQSKTKKAKLEQSFNLIYNGKNVDSGYSDELMKPASGEIKLIANDSGNYSTVVITAYESYVVDSVNRGLKTIYDKDKNSVKLDYESENISFTDKSGKELSFSSIAEGSTIHVAAPLDGDDIKVIITTSKAEGTVNRVSQDEINIDGTDYDLVDSFADKYGLPELGKNVEAYFDLDGRVIYLDESGVSGMKVGYITKCFIEESGDDYIVRIFTSEGKFVDMTLNSTITVDGTKYGSSDAAALISDMLSEEQAANADKAKHRIVLYSSNSSNKLTKLDTAVNTADGEDTIKLSINITENETFSYKQSTGTFYNNNKNHFFSLSEDAIVFSIPADESNTSEYEVKSKSSFGWADYEIYPFKSDTSSLLVSYAVEFADETNNIGTDGYVITKIVDGLNSEGEETKILELYNGTKKTYALKEDDLWKSEWDKGTIVRIAVNSRNEISAIEEAKTKGTIISDYDYSGKGWIYQREGGWGYFTTAKPSSGMDMSAMVLIPVDKFNIVVYNKRSEECYTGTVGDIVDYVSDPANCTEVYITMSYENPKSMICVVDY
ncbi:MAG: S-layer homology domain-containing protein [Candidatus Ornithomonoglobus sp.]